MDAEAQSIDWGIEDRGAVRGFRIAAAALVAAGVALLLFVSAITGAMVIALGAGYAITAALMVRSSRRGRLVERDRILDTLLLEGAERVLDLRCGTGMLTAGAAQRLPRGHVTALAAPGEEEPAAVARRNLQAAGVAGRTAVAEGDPRALPFADGAFDAVVSSLALRSLSGRAEREQAALEIARVLGPGGRVALLEVRGTREVAEALEALTPVAGVERSGRRWTTWPPSRLITGRRAG